MRVFPVVFLIPAYCGGFLLLNEYMKLYRIWIVLIYLEMNMNIYNTLYQYNVYLYIIWVYIYLNKGRIISTRQILSGPAGLRANCFEWDYADRKFWDLDLILSDSKRKHISLMSSVFTRALSVWCLMFSVRRNLLMQSLDNWLSVHVYIGCVFFERERRIEWP